MHLLFFNIYRSRFLPAEKYKWLLKGVAPGNTSFFSLFLCPQSSIPPFLMVCSFTGLCGVYCPDWSGLWQLRGGFAIISSHSWLTNKQSPEARCDSTHIRIDLTLHAAWKSRWPGFVGAVAGLWPVTGCVQRRQNSNIL